MKKIVFKYINYLYLISLFLIIFFYLFPGDIVSYFIYGDLKSNLSLTKNPLGSKMHFIINTGGYSINHTLVFCYITAIGLITYFRDKFYVGLIFFICISIILEVLHFIVPNRSFELIDVISNLIGVIITSIIIKKLKR